MKIIFIRHAEPDYEKDSLTEKGFREAEYLSERTKDWDITKIYCSPLGRAQDTAAPTLKKTGKEMEIRKWLREFDAPIWDPEAGRRIIPWDRTPRYMNIHRELYDISHWGENTEMLSGSVKQNMDWVWDGLDSLLAEYGYHRDGMIYRVDEDAQREAVIVCFCHFGVIAAMMAHLINTAPHALWQGACLLPTSVTIVGSEEREPGIAQFRFQVMGDLSHLKRAGEPISHYAYFTEPFQG